MTMKLKDLEELIQNPRLMKEAKFKKRKLSITEKNKKFLVKANLVSQQSSHKFLKILEPRVNNQIIKQI